jgi:hypothetical protein
VNDCYSNGLLGLEGHTPGQLQQGLHACDPPCDVPFSECVVDLRCVCKSGFLPTFLPAPILSSRPPKLIYCSPDPLYLDGRIVGDMAANASMAAGTKLTVGDAAKENATTVQYYPSKRPLLSLLCIIFNAVNEQTSELVAKFVRLFEKVIADKGCNGLSIMYVCTYLHRLQITKNGETKPTPNLVEGSFPFKSKQIHKIDSLSHPTLLCTYVCTNV